MKNRRNIKLNKKFVQNQNSQQRRNNYNQNIFPVKSEVGRFIDGRKRLIFNKNKRGLRASGLSLLPLALRPLLLNDKRIRIFVFLFIMLGFGFILQNSYINSASAKSITLTIPSEALNLSVSPGSGSVFKKSSPGTISVATDSSRGYSLSIQSKTSSDLLNGLNKITSIVSPLSESDYESLGDINTWGYLPSKLGGSINTDFQPGPTTEPITLDTTDTSSSGTDYELTLATKIDNSLPAGNYSNTFILSATTNDPSYDNIMQNWGGCDYLSSGEEINLLDTRDNKIYSVAKLKDDLCWMTENLAIGKEDGETKLTSDDSDVASEFTISASSDNPNANDAYDSTEIHLDSTYGGYYTWYTATAGEGTPDYSIIPSSGYGRHSICPKGWRLPTQEDFTYLHYSLGGTSSGNYNLAELTNIYKSSPNNFLMGGFYKSGALTSIDNEAHYWTSTNALTNDAYYFLISNSTIARTYSSSGGNSKSNLKSVRCVARSDNLKKIDTMQNVDKWGDSVEEGKPVISKDVRDDKEYTVARLADGRLWMTQNLEIGNTDSEMKLTSDTSDTAGDFTLLASSDSPNASNAYDSREIHLDSTYGGYYSWYTATAGEGTQDVSTNGQNVEHSICPKGWRLPTKDEFVALDKALGGTGETRGDSTNFYLKYTGTPNNFLMGGYYYSGTASNVGSYTYYWSSTAVDASRAYALSFDSSRVAPQVNPNKYGLYSVRCVSRTDDNNIIGSMQTVDEWGDSVKQGQKIKTNDIRDGRIYTAARLADGRLWMTKNLAISNTNLTSIDSDVVSSFRIPASTKNPNSNNRGYTSTELYIDPIYGGYYTWYTATAREGTREKTSGNTTHSICPKGWRLPTSNDVDNLSSNQSMDMPKRDILSNFKFGGLYSGGLEGSVSQFHIGTMGFYQTSTPWVYDNRYFQVMDIDYYNLSFYTRGKNSLIPIRCISRTDDPTMQNVEKWGSTVKTGETKTVPDIRDGKEYTVARLADNKLWMTKNLEIQNKTLTDKDSDLAENATFTLPSSTSKPNSSNSYSSTQLHVDSTYGGYYTWYTATAGEGTRDVSTDGANVEHSICPKGWRLPTKQDFIDLDKAFGGTGANGQSSSTSVSDGKTLLQMYQNAPAKFLMGGNYYSGSASSVGSNAYYWSSTAYSANSAYDLYFLSSSVTPQNSDGKAYLRSVRCVSRQ